MTEAALYDYFDPKYTESEALREVFRQTERHIEEQHRLAAAADQRALAFSAVQIVLIGLLVADNVPSSYRDPGLWITALLVAAISLAVYSARPTRLYGSGSNGAPLADYVGQSSGYLLPALIQRNDLNIGHNFRSATKSARVFKLPLLMSFLAAVLMLGNWAASPHEGAPQTVGPRGASGCADNAGSFRPMGTVCRACHITPS